MRRKTDFFKYEGQALTIVTTALNEQEKLYKEHIRKEELIKKKKEDEKKKKDAEEAAKKKKVTEDSGQCEEVTDEEAERIMKEEAEKKRLREMEDNEEEKGGEKGKDAEMTNEGEEGEGKDGKKSNKLKPDAGNGGTTEKYSWIQTLDDLTVNVPIPDNVTSKQLEVKYKQTTLFLGVKVRYSSL